MLRNCLLVLLIAAMQPVAARMYQWVDPASGRTQLSGTPPAWYRSGGDNPRVFVFENGHLVDDTGIAVKDAERRRLRQKALIIIEEDAEAARKKAEQSALLKSQLEDEESQLPAMLPATPAPVRTGEATEQGGGQDAEADSASGTPELSEEQLAELRNLISEWEARNQNRAREMLTPRSQSTDQEAEARETLQEFLEQNPGREQ